MTENKLKLKMSRAGIIYRAISDSGQIYKASTNKQAIIDYIRNFNK